MKLRHLLLGTAMALGSASAANAAITTPDGWYLSLGAGANWLEDANWESGDAGGPTSSYEYSFDTGHAYVASVGYAFLNNWRVEFEVAHRGNDADKYCLATGDCYATDAEIWELSQMVNVLYDIPIGGNWSASVGAGIGGNLVVWDWGASNYAEYDDYVVAGQLIGELAYQFSSRWQAFAAYHYMIMDDPRFDEPGDIEDGDYYEIDKTEHTLMLGIRFDLQRDGAAPPPVVPQAPVKGPKQFIVFFGFNKSNLTPEAARVVADAAAAAKEYGSASISVVGHTDTSGSDAYNQALSMRRSQTVKDGLIAQGIPGSMVSTSGRGEAELMVQTGNGVKEPQNRRATMDLN